jgi:hypothetical protein
VKLAVHNGMREPFDRTLLAPGSPDSFDEAARASAESLRGCLAALAGGVPAGLAAS